MYAEIRSIFNNLITLQKGGVIMQFFKKGKEERRRKLLTFWEELKKSKTLTTAELLEIILRQPLLVNEVVEELFLRENDLEKLLDLQRGLYERGQGYYGNPGTLKASEKMAEKLIDNSFGKDLYRIFGSLRFSELKEKAARKILQGENIPIEILKKIIIFINSEDLKEKSAGEILKRKLSDSESECLAWIIAYVGPLQRERAYGAMMKRKDWKDNLLLLFNMNKAPGNISFIEAVAKEFLEAWGNWGDGNDVIYKVLYSIAEHVKGKVGKKAAERIFSFLFNQSPLNWKQLSDFIWKCGEYPDLQEKAANEVLKREKECCDSEIFCCIIRHVPSSWFKRMAAGVILDRFANAKNLELVIKNVPSLKKQARGMLEEIELAESEKPGGILKQILNLKV